MTAKILEIFRSIQGEGQYAGYKQVFVRFFECNMHCVWCDTPHSIGDTTRRYDDMRIDEIVEKVNTLWDHSHSVTLTGGEPLLQPQAVFSLAKKLRSAQRPIHLETNGTLSEAMEKVAEVIDVVSMDLKLPSSTACQPYWKEHNAFLQAAAHKELFVKVVISKTTTDEDFYQAVDLVRLHNPTRPFIIQPNTYDLADGVMKRCLQFEEHASKQLKNVRLLPQVHKMMKIR
ncbi:MAG: 7-carboxy-7-deazaguanine synthase QueE [Candidatus Omnitrophica bacterium]|nr:7-carboxy-7-deazaguanine synthase QueE [Candidatus Omnitrophota bacterium]